MNTEALIAIIGGGIGILGLITFLTRRPKALNKTYFRTQWQELQRFCANKDTWPIAIINADKLLDEALRKRHYKGKSMGERLVSAQRILSDNDSVWFGHKLRNQLVHEANVKMTEKDVKNALVGLRQALRDLGAL